MLFASIKEKYRLCFLPIEYTKLGTEVNIKSPYGNLTAKVVELPFFDSKKRIPIK